MKGTLFQKPVEYRIEVDGESWRQGDAIAGTLTVVNRGTDVLSNEGIHVSLAYGKFKEVHAKAEDAFEVLETKPFTGNEMSWVFQTERNCPITDKSASLFLLYGRGKSTPILGHLQLNIQPFQVIEDFLYRFKTDFRFVEKSKKAGRKGVDVKLVPPSGQSFASLDHVMMCFHFDKETMHVRYVFAVKKIEATASSFDMKKTKREVEQSFAPAQFRHDDFEAAQKQALAEVEAKVLF